MRYRCSHIWKSYFHWRCWAAILNSTQLRGVGYVSVNVTHHLKWCKNLWGVSSGMWWPNACGQGHLVWFMCCQWSCEKMWRGGTRKLNVEDLHVGCCCLGTLLTLDVMKCWAKWWMKCSFCLSLCVFDLQQWKVLILQLCVDGAGRPFRVCGLACLSPTAYWVGKGKKKLYKCIYNIGSLGNLEYVKATNVIHC